MILTGQIRLDEPDAIRFAVAMPAPSPALRAPSPRGERDRGLRFETGTNAQAGEYQLFTAPTRPSPSGSVRGFVRTLTLTLARRKVDLDRANSPR